MLCCPPSHLILSLNKQESTLMSKNVVNIINFIRGVEPRLEMDLHQPVVEEMRLAKEHNLPTTWLLQHDAFMDDWYFDFLKENMPASHEIGVWIEITQELVEKANLKWRGRYSWDWHTNVGFSVGYTPNEREKIADVLMNDFKARFGYYPQVVGSWLFDAHIFQYLADKYQIISGCNCKDQWGTDGYTLWGGYWANGYYPSKINSYLPASSAKNQIHVPIFRMLGSDPIYQYESDPNTENGQSVVTMEPVYTGFENCVAGGGVPAWVDWFLQENFNEPTQGFSYVQIGQENSFGWARMKVGLEYQYAKIAEMQARKQLEVLTLGDTGRYFRQTYKTTPPTSVITHSDWKKENRSSIWQLNRFGRMNFLRTESKSLVLRDWQIFSDEYQEEFLQSPCPTHDCVYDALPILDGMLWKSENLLSRIEFCIDGVAISGGFANIQETGDSISFDWQKSNEEIAFKVTSGNNILEITNFAKGKFQLKFAFARENLKKTKIALRDEKTLEYHHNQMHYLLKVESGSIKDLGNSFVISSNDKHLKLSAELEQGKC